MASRWRIFRRPIISEPDRVVVYTQAAIALHNYLRTTESSVYCPPGFVDGEDGTGNVIEGSWRDDDETYCLEPLSHIGSNRQVVYTNVAAMIEILSLGICDLLLKCETCTRTILIVQQERCAGKKHMCSEQNNNNNYLHETIIARVRGGKRFRGKFSFYQDLVNPELGHCLLPWSEPPQRGSHLMAKMALLIQLFFFLLLSCKEFRLFIKSSSTVEVFLFLTAGGCIL